MKVDEVTRNRILHEAAERQTDPVVSTVESWAGGGRRGLAAHRLFALTLVDGSVLVRESDSGKTLLATALVRILTGAVRSDGGTIALHGSDDMLVCSATRGGPSGDSLMLVGDIAAAATVAPAEAEFDTHCRVEG